MKTLQKVIRFYFRTLSLIMPALAAKQAFKLFQRTQRSSIREREKGFYKKASHGWVGEILYYKLGDPQNPLVFLIHGWNGHAGNFSAIADALVAQGKYVIAIDLPAHGGSLLTHTNLFKIETALAPALQRLADGRSFSVIAHSFGSAASVFTLARQEIKVDRLVLMSSPDRLQDIFKHFMKMIGLRKSAFKYVQKVFRRQFNMGIEEINVSDYVRHIETNKFVVIHDLYDRILPFNYGLAVSSTRADASMIMLEKVGHYRMLWNEEVINLLSELFEDKKLATEALPHLELAVLGSR